jgi:hypothetical protein
MEIPTFSTKAIQLFDFILMAKKRVSIGKKKSKNSKYIFTTSKHVQNSKIGATVKIIIKKKKLLKFFEGGKVNFFAFSNSPS